MTDSEQFAKDLERDTVELLRPGGRHQATLRLIQRRGRLTVAKEFLSSPAIYQKLVARFMLDREQAALSRLDAVGGVPKVEGRPHSACLLLEHRSGTPLEKISPGELPLSALEEVGALLQQIHQSQVIHGDIGHDCNGRLGRETNFLWCPRLGWTLLDFGGSLRGPGFFPWEKRLRRLLRAHDLLFLTKLVLSHFPALENHRYLTYPCRLEYEYWRWWKKLGKL